MYFAEKFAKQSRLLDDHPEQDSLREMNFSARRPSSQPQGTIPLSFKLHSYIFWNPNNVRISLIHMNVI
jgi:hypothetical protein